ncbi:hypothetical protein BH10PSE6_BH10PSE6_23810 [soil metagenome]
MSREASIEMRSTGLGMDATAGTATASSVSMFQTNSDREGTRQLHSR